MGNAQSPAADPRFTAATRSFGKQELDDLRSLFVSLASQSQSNGEFISQSVFQDYFGIPGPLGSRLFQLFSQKRNDGKLTFEDFVISKAVYEKGIPSEIEHFLYELCDTDGDGMVTRSDLEAVLTSIHSALFSSEKAEPGLSTHPDINEVFLYAATFSKEVEGVSGKIMSLGDFRSWCNLLPSVRKFLGSLVMPPDSDRPGFQVPYLHHPENVDSELLILRNEYAWHIGGALSQHELEDWNLLYHSAINGLSFATFMGSISSGDGPTVLIIKDTEAISSSILIPPYRSKQQFAMVNYSSESIPNGIGFGGRENHFGFFLSANFDQGHTFTCPTFNSPCLSKTNRIHPEVIECWGVVPKGALNEKSEALKGTVLERFKEDRNMLKLIGLASSSD